MKKSFTGPNWKKGSGNSPSAISHSSWPWYGRATAVALLIWLVTFAPWPWPVTPVLGATFMVNSPIDSFDAMPGDGICADPMGGCSLRAAIMEANALAGSDTIVLQPGQAYTLLRDLTGGDEDTAAEDDLDITSTITIQGNGGTIQRSALVDCVLDEMNVPGEFRIFEVHLSGNLTLQNLTVKQGCAEGDSDEDEGSGIWNKGRLTITDCTIKENIADFSGGGLTNSFDGRATITSSTIMDNSGFLGGGILNAGTLNMTETTLSGNDAFDGAGVYNTNSLQISKCTLSRNMADVRGGGIFNNSGLVRITNSTIYGNSAIFGGGIYLRFGNIEANFVTIATNGVFGIDNAIGTVRIRNSIVANNALGDCSNRDQWFNEGTVNMATDSSCPGFTQVPSTGVGGLNLGPLQVNAPGETATLALPSDSVAIDAATNCSVTDDQRGVRRPLDGDADGLAACDLGAYEAPCPSDLFPPILTCPPNRTVQAEAGCVASVSVGRATAIDNCTALPTVVGTRSDGMALTAPYPLGVTNITWAATDTAGNRSTCTQTITVTNAAPTANAGPDQVLPHATAGVPTTVILDGAASSDPNPAQVLSFEWTQTGGPLIPLASANTATPSFVAPCPVSNVVLTFQLKVTDSCGVMSTDNVAVTVTNAAPTANAGPDQVLPHATAGVPTTVILDGAASNDPEGQPLSFQWTQTAGTPVTLNRANTARPSFVAPCPVSSVVLTFQLKVTDSCGVMSTDNVVVTVTNAAPTANAGPDQIVDEGMLVTLTGTGSDANGDNLTFQWTQTGGPAVVINNANTATATFTAPEVGTLECVALTFQLKVTDSCGVMATSSVVVRVQDTLVLQDDATPTKCVVIRRDCGATNSGTYCMKVGGMTFTGPLTVTQQGNTVNAQSTAADPNVAQGSIDLGRCRGNFRLTITRNNPTVTHTIASNVNACDDVCACP